MLGELLRRFYIVFGAYLLTFSNMFLEKTLMRKRKDETHGKIFNALGFQQIAYSN